MPVAGPGRSGRPPVAHPSRLVEHARPTHARPGLPTALTPPSLNHKELLLLGGREMCIGDTVQALCALCDSKEIARIKTAGLENNDDACLQPPNWVPGVGSAVRQRERSAQEAPGSSTPTRGRLLCFNILKAQSVAAHFYHVCAFREARNLIEETHCFFGESLFCGCQLDGCGGAVRRGTAPRESTASQPEPPSHPHLSGNTVHMQRGGRGQRISHVSAPISYLYLRRMGVSAGFRKFESLNPKKMMKNGWMQHPN